MSRYKYQYNVVSDIPTSSRFTSGETTTKTFKKYAKGPFYAENMKLSERKGRDFWGRHFWATIHSVCAAYTPDKAKYMKDFIISLFNLLPCAECIEHARSNINNIPIDNYLANNHSLFFWSYLFHDTVNQQWSSRNPDKPPRLSPPYESVKSYYFNALKSECKECHE